MEWYELTAEQSRILEENRALFKNLQERHAKAVTFFNSQKSIEQKAKFIPEFKKISSSYINMRVHFNEIKERYDKAVCFFENENTSLAEQETFIPEFYKVLAEYRNLVYITEAGDEEMQFGFDLTEDFRINTMINGLQKVS